MTAYCPVMLNLKFKITGKLIKVTDTVNFKLGFNNMMRFLLNTTSGSCSRPSVKWRGGGWGSGLE